MTVIISLLGVYNHIARLRSWRERKRTAAFAAAYFIAWAFDFVVPLLSGTLLALIVYPPSRTFLFPPAPVALVNTSTGGIQKPRAGVLGSHDSATGAPENHKGEAVEKEANNFVTGIASVAVSSATCRCILTPSLRVNLGLTRAQLEERFQKLTMRMIRPRYPWKRLCGPR